MQTAGIAHKPLTTFLLFLYWLYSVNYAYLIAFAYMKQTNLLYVTPYKGYTTRRLNLAYLPIFNDIPKMYQQKDTYSSKTTPPKIIKVNYSPRQNVSTQKYLNRAHWFFNMICLTAGWPQMWPSCIDYFKSKVDTTLPYLPLHVG